MAFIFYDIGLKWSGSECASNIVENTSLVKDIIWHSFFRHSFSWRSRMLNLLQPHNKPPFWCQRQNFSHNVTLTWFKCMTACFFFCRLFLTSTHGSIFRGNIFRFALDSLFFVFRRVRSSFLIVTQSFLRKNE